MDRMKDEPVFLALASKASDYLGGRGEVKAQAKIALRRVEHFYYKTDTVYGAMRRMTIAQQEAQQQAAPVPQVLTLQVLSPEISSLGDLSARVHRLDWGGAYPAAKCKTRLT